VAQASLSALVDERLIVAGVGCNGAALDMEDVIHHCLKEGAIVADEKHGRVQSGQIVFQPLGGLEVQVIGRLIEQQDIGRRYQLLSQPHSSPLSSAQP
jgi:hypothetical protein